MDEQELMDMTHEITDELQRNASIKLSEARAYYDGYVQASEDYGRRLRAELINQTNLN